MPIQSGNYRSYVLKQKRRIRLYFYRPGKDFPLSRLYAPISKYVPCDRFDATFTPSLISFIHPDKDLYRIVNSPEEADFIIFPLNLSWLVYRCGITGDIPGHVDDPNGNTKVVDFITSLPFYSGAEEKHVFFVHHDWSGPFGLKCVLFNQSINNGKSGANSVSCPHWIPDAGKGDIPSKILYHSSFVGYIGSHKIRPSLIISLIEHLQQESDLSIYLDVTDRFHWHHSDHQVLSGRENLFRKISRQSISILCPRGTGLNSIRFFEAMSMGRIPILVSDECVLPLEDEINWDSLIIRIPEAQIGDIGPIISSWFKKETTASLLSKCLTNRVVWETYFHPSKFQEFIAKCLLKKLSNQQAPDCFENTTNRDASPPLLSTRQEL